MDTMEEYRKTTERTNQIIWTAQENQRNFNIFVQAVEQWKSWARWSETELAKSAGYVLPPPPKAPLVKVFNPEKFEEFWVRRHHNGEQLPDNFFVDMMPLTLPANFYDYKPAPPPAPAVNTGRPVGKKDPTFGKGWFEHIAGSVKADGSQYQPGDVWTDPDTDLDYRLSAFEPSPFHPGYIPLKWGLEGVAKQP